MIKAVFEALIDYMVSSEDFFITFHNVHDTIVFPDESMIITVQDPGTLNWANIFTSIDELEDLIGRARERLNEQI